MKIYDEQNSILILAAEDGQNLKNLVEQNIVISSNATV